MWPMLRRLLGKVPAQDLTPEPEREPPTGREEFLRFLQENGVMVLATKIERGRIDFVVHEYPSGEKVTPLFSGSLAARRWIEGREIRKVTAFPSLTLEASWLVEQFKSAEKIVFDPDTPWERILGPADVAMLAGYLSEREA